MELDKINLSNILSSDTRESMPAADQASPPPLGTTSHSKKISIRALAAFLAVLALLAVITIFNKQQDITLTYLNGSTSTSLENYLRVGPVTATLANEDIIKFSIDIDCGNADLKEQLAGKDTLIRDKIVAVLTAPGTEALIKKSDYETVKANLKESLGDIGSEPIGDIYVADLIIY